MPLKKGIDKHIDSSTTKNSAKPLIEKPRASKDHKTNVEVGDPNWRRKSRIDITVDAKFLSPPTLRRSNGLPRFKANQILENVNEEVRSSSSSCKEDSANQSKNHHPHFGGHASKR